MNLFSKFRTDFKITHILPQWRVLLYIILGYGLFQIIFHFSDETFKAIDAYSGPGLTFALAISTMLRETKIRIILFLLLSTLLYFLMVRLALVQAYFSANPFFIGMASVSGAVLETLLFCFLFQCLDDLNYVEIFLIVLFAVLTAFVLTTVTFSEKDDFLGILIWQLAIGYAFTRIYTRKLSNHKSPEHP